MELQWIGVAFALGLMARGIGQPPLVGFLVAGFALELLGFRPDASLEQLADVGLLLLLFTIGLKVDVRTMVRPQVWGTALACMVPATLVGAAGVMAVQSVLPLGEPLGWSTALVLGFALSFSSTVLTAKVLEDRDDLGSFYGRITIGVLVVQDLAAVLYLAAAKGAWPSPWAASLVLLVPVTLLARKILVRIGHGELLVLYGFTLTLGAAGWFEAVGIKGDLGALVAGALLASHPKSKELFWALLSFKDLFLVGFFLSVGLMGLPTLRTVFVAVLLAAVLLPAKVVGFGALFTGLSLRVRTATLGALTLGSFSEFALIVTALASKQGWLADEWVVAIAISVATSFLLATPLNREALHVYERFKEQLRRLERTKRLPEEELGHAHDAEVLVFGMGPLGLSTYTTLRAQFGESVVGFDIDPDRVAAHRAAGRRVLRVSATDPDGWEGIGLDTERVRLVVLALSSLSEDLDAIEQFRAWSKTVKIAAVARFEDEVEELRRAGCDLAYPVMEEAGLGFARHVLTGTSSADQESHG